ncbi:DNA polymerase [Paenibacillus alvei]|uniref:DNA polymerase I n=1 Tax=Paenibacillus alvei TaxID=44250 RepID=A0ABT4GUK4_PAEAL|nr:DNA polymerase [Paenibacillus alvei]MCY9760379.1 DNA polymerase [Paenibacillus alvei]MCY9767671.1 DNA polymerase [Paenibacillus alvei]
MEVKLTLRSPNDNKARDAVKQAVERRSKAKETIEEAWERILAMKNNEADGNRLREVREAMLSGVTGRRPDDASKRFSKAEAMRIWAELQERKRSDTLRKMVEDIPRNYFLINSERLLTRLIERLRKETEVAVDTETTGVDVYTDVIVGISLTLPSVSIPPLSEKGMHVYIPVMHDVGEQLSRDYVLSQLHEFLYDEDVGKVLHNAIFDISMFRRHGYDLRGVTWDTMIAMHLLNENGPSFRLKDLAPKYLGVESDTFAELFGKTPFNEIQLDIALAYAAKDTDLTWRLYQFQRKHFAKIPTVLEYYETVEVPLLYVIVDLEANGYILDLDFAKEYGEQLSVRAKELHDKLIDQLSKHHDGDGELNLNSTPQMKAVLSKAIGKELPNMDAKKTLKPLAREFEIIAVLLEYRKITKLSGTYIDTLPTKQNQTTKRWHSRFNPMGTVTGRFSSGKDEDASDSNQFNVQNQPEEARKMFVAPEGKVLVSADFKAQEIRCTAYLSGEPVLIEAFEKGIDPYANMASMYYKRPYHEVYKLPNGEDTPERKAMKVVWLATLYGMSDYSLADMLGLTKAEASAFKEELFSGMPKLSAWLKANENDVARYGFVWADKQQRKRRLPDGKLRRKEIPYGKWNDPKYDEWRKHNAKINRAMRQGTNARVQGSSAIQTKVTMIKAHEECKRREGWALWGTIHDELVFEIPEDFTREDIATIERIMTQSYRWGTTVANGTDIAIMRRWGKGVTPDEWFANKQ